MKKIMKFGKSSENNTCLKGVLLSLVLALCSLYASAQNWVSGYSYRKTITLNSAYVNEDLTDFPFYFSLTHPDLEDPDNCTPVKHTSAFDVIFTDTNPTPNQLDHEIISYDAGTGVYQIWVNVPNVSSSADTEIYMFYGNRNASDPAPLDPWPTTKYRGVWHFDNGGADSTLLANNLDGNVSSLATSVVDNGLSFDGASQFASQAYDSDFDFEDNSFTISGWIKMPNKSVPATSITQITTTASGWIEEALNSSDVLVGQSSLQFGRNTVAYNDFFIVGLKFDAVDVPEGITIENAYLKFTSNEDNSGLARFTIAVENTMDPANLTAGNVVTTRDLSSLEVLWVPTDWVNGEQYESSDISPLIQLLIDHPDGWDASTKDLVLAIEGYGIRESNNSVDLVIEYEDGTANVLTTSAVIDNGDDIEQAASDGSVKITSALDFDPGTNDWLATRFTEIDVPNGAIVDSVKVEFIAAASNSELTTVNIYVENSSNSEAYEIVDNEISDRGKGGPVAWNPEAWVSGSTYQTADIGSLFSDFFSDENWAEGNAIAIFFEPSTGNRSATHRGSGSSNAPQLLIYYHISENEPQSIVSRHNNGGFELWTNNVGKLCFGIDAGGTWDEDIHVKSLSRISDQQWHHFAAVKENEVDISLYLDGEVQEVHEMNSVLEVTLVSNDGDNDVEEGSSGSVTMGSINLEIGNRGGDPQNIGLRFENVAVPSGATATVESAFLQIVSNENNTDANQCRVTIIGDDRGDTPIFTGTNGLISTNISTNGTDATAIWDIPAFVGQKISYNSPDIRAIVQEIITDGTWASGNSMSFYLETLGDPGERVIRSYDNDPGAVAALFIQYRITNLGSISGDTPTLYVGDDGTGTRYFEGALDELQVVDTILTAAEVYGRYANLTQSDFSSISLTADMVSWTGATDSDWHDATNWSSGMVPTADMDIRIPATSNDPVIDSDVSVGNVRADVGVSLDLNGQMLNVDCSCNVAQFFNGTVEFTGDSVALQSPRTKNPTIINACK